MLMGLMSISFCSFSQCDIKDRINPDGSIFYYIEPENFYHTSSNSLKGGIVTDKENYFLELMPVPFPAKPAGHKLKDGLEVILCDGSTFKIEHYDTRYVENNTVLEMLFLIDNKALAQFMTIEVAQVKINMMGDEGTRTYAFKLHKSALKEQLDCFSKEKAPKK